MDLNKVLKNTTNDYYDFGYFKFPVMKEYKNEVCWELNCEFFGIFWKKYPHLISEQSLGEGPYELGKVCLNKGDVVIDAGANIGLFSILSSLKGCITYSFEPSEKCCNIMEKVKELNNHIDFNIYKLALYNTNEEKTFYVNSNDCGVSTLKDDLTHDRKINSNYKVQCITLDKFVNENRINKVDFIKADIEGSEKEMIEGAKDVIKEFSPMLSICSYHYKNDVEDLIKLIKSINQNYTITQRFSKIYAWK